MIPSLFSAALPEPYCFTSIQSHHRRQHVAKRKLHFCLIRAYPPIAVLVIKNYKRVKFLEPMVQKVPSRRGRSQSDSMCICVYMRETENLTPSAPTTQRPCRSSPAPAPPPHYHHHHHPRGTSPPPPTPRDPPPRPSRSRASGSPSPPRPGSTRTPWAARSSPAPPSPPWSPSSSPPAAP